MNPQSLPESEWVVHGDWPSRRPRNATTCAPTTALASWWLSHSSLLGPGSRTVLPFLKSSCSAFPGFLVTWYEADITVSSLLRNIYSMFCITCGDLSVILKIERAELKGPACRTGVPSHRRWGGHSWTQWKRHFWSAWAALQYGICQVWAVRLRASYCTSETHPFYTEVPPA